MIHDGYNQFAEIRAEGQSVRIEFRPALQHERTDLFGRVSFMQDNDLADELFQEEIFNRVFSWSIPPREMSRALKAAVLKAVLGQEPRSTERDDAENLTEGLRFQIDHPGMAGVTCEACRTWWMDPTTGEISQRHGEKLLRPAGTKLLCQTNAGCPKGTFENQKGLSAKNQQALRHYLECRATGQFPDDAIVKQNARIIANILREQDQISFVV